jgi:phosphatidylserine/phosphatidylglycerophosphate/cardiolipin synthase-like enzyme
MNKLDYRFPWRSNNRFTLLVDGEEFFPEMLEAIRGARSFVLLEMYLVESGALMERFVRAFAELPKGVDVYLLLDDFGARGLCEEDRRRLLDMGIHLTFYNPLRYGRLRRNLLRDHRKLLVVDGSRAYLGGFGITDEFLPLQEKGQAWHELAVGIEGNCVADWVEVFAENWERWNRKASRIVSPPLPFQGESRGRVTISRGSHQAEMQRSLIARVQRSQRRIWIVTAYFVPSRKVRRRLRAAARRGIDVRLLLPGAIIDHPAVRHAGRRFYLRLLRHGVRIFEYQSRFIHAKAVLCDDWVSLGSSNIDRWNLRWNLEANQEVDDKEFAHKLAERFQADFSQSREIRLQQWRLRPWYRRFREWFWGMVDKWLERHSRRRS